MSASRNSRSSTVSDCGRRRLFEGEMPQSTGTNRRALEAEHTIQALEMLREVWDKCFLQMNEVEKCREGPTCQGASARVLRVRAVLKNWGRHAGFSHQRWIVSPKFYMKQNLHPKINATSRFFQKDSMLKDSLLVNQYCIQEIFKDDFWNERKLYWEKAIRMRNTRKCNMSVNIKHFLISRCEIPVKDYPCCRVKIIAMQYGFTAYANVK